MTRQAPRATAVPKLPASEQRLAQGDLPEAPQAPQTAGPTLDGVPLATALPPPHRDVLAWETDIQSKHGDLYLLSGNVDVHYRDHTFHADSVRYNAVSGELEAEGHVRLSGGENDEYVQAARATYNVRDNTGRFYDVRGSVGLHSGTGLTRTGTFSSGAFLFSGRLVVKTGPENYDVYDGSVTSCLRPNPDWLLSSKHIGLADGKAHARGSVFRLLGVPVLLLPYVTHPVDSTERQSGLLIPVLGQSSTKGLILGDQVYFSLGRSADLTAGLEYFSLRGFSESGVFRYRGPGDDFLNARISALQDRGIVNSTTKLLTNQGGQDVTASFRRQLSPHTRAVGDIEYLSSYTYREAFTENFNQAVSSDITSIGYVTHQADGYALDGRVDRYQGLKRVPVGTQPGQQVHILHVPSFDFTAVDHPLAGTPLVWSFTGSAAGVKRVQPNFASGGVIQRLDLRPELSLPLHGAGWSVLSSVAVRETLYSRSRQAPYPAGAAPVELTSPLNRALIDINVAIRPPAIERTFTVPASLGRVFGTSVRHTVEPELTYRNVHGAGDFLSVLRFDEIDLASDTDELEYGVTQHLYFRPLARVAKARPGCPVATAPLPDKLGVSAPLPAASGEDLAASGEDLNGAQTGSATASELPSAPSANRTTIPDVLEPTPDAATDVNGIPSASAAAPDAPLRTNTEAQTAREACAPAPAGEGQREWFSWRLAQRHFFDPTFGGAVIQGRRNLLESTLSLSGIAFLTEPRSISPLISRMRFRTSSHTDVEWDFDLDTGASKFTSNNIFLDAREGPFFGGVSYARLNAPGRFSSENLDTNQLVTSPTSNFSQARLLLGYGDPVKAGLSVAANAGLDLNLGNVQYAALQTSYNWNCCGLAIEYRKYELGSVRNENAYRFNFTLANIGTAGNLRRAERLF